MMWLSQKLPDRLSRQVRYTLVSAAGASQDFLSMCAQLLCVSTQGCLPQLAAYLVV